MAVTKMKKMTIITENLLKDVILQTIQGMQNVEIRNVFVDFENNNWRKKYFKEVTPQESVAKQQEFQIRLKKIEEILTFIEHHGDSKAKRKQLKRYETDLQTLEEAYDEITIDQEIEVILMLKKQWEQSTNNKEHLLESEEYYSKWQNLDVLPHHVTNSIKTMELGVLASENWDEFKQQMEQLEYLYIEMIYQDEKETYVSFVYLNEMKQSVIDVCRRFSVKIESYEDSILPKEQLMAVKKDLSTNHQSRKKLTKLIGQKRTQVKVFQLAEEVILAKLQREKVNQNILTTEQLLVLQGWIGESDIATLTYTLEKKISKESFYLTFEEPTAEEINQEVPTKLLNHELVKPFELLTEMYSLPKYNEIDPTPWFVPFFLVFFGMMVADVGYGLLMLVGTTVALKKLTLPRGTSRFMAFFKILSIPTMIWGLIYNSFFGLSMPYQPILSTSEDVITILLLSVIFGFIQIIVGLALNAKENIRKKNYLAAVSEGFAWQGILIGIVISLLGKLLLKQPAFFIIGIGLISISAVIILLAPLKGNRSKAKGLAKGAYNLYGLTSYIGDMVSFTRLMALGISGGSIAAAFNMLVDFMPPIAKFSIGILLIIALHGLNIFLSLLSAYVHGARLQYVEFFGKFYKGGGRAFEPLKTKEKYVNIEQIKK
ncbi:V-type ATP synthase subunit I [Vagococcus xieshaowenii]|uniref:V-type ATP synthase subunit I n=1 Tax=Vagococcus xieshaowenii TaxID=2562451 RepID=A0AAJ5EFZ5_9ENTE|nr:V-type ATP synthase subunit I [Vagococcus xieshaowenii]QCA29021.1 V-type ATP synthase subunit I [Vagococcus xieshaowenii]TFZ41003.1 V-type ATP synthase subunit I [Vagococcus xieshaowenii]